MQLKYVPEMIFFFELLNVLFDSTFSYPHKRHLSTFCHSTFVSLFVRAFSTIYEKKKKKNKPLKYSAHLDEINCYKISPFAI